MGCLELAVGVTMLKEGLPWRGWGGGCNCEEDVVERKGRTHWELEGSLGGCRDGLQGAERELIGAEERVR